MKKIVVALGVAALAISGGAWLALQQETDTPEAALQAQQTVIAFTLPDLEDQARSIDEWRGRVILLNFWATWCPPCREEIPMFMEAQEQLAGRGLQIVSVAIDDKRAVTEYRDSLFMNYPILLGSDGAMTLMEQYGNRVGTLPYSVIIAPDGRIVARKMGAFTRAELENELKPWLATEKG